jgi:hypothetical protein
LAQTIYAWGAQIEQGANATSYIATAGASVTRAMDVCQMPVGAWFNPAAYSLLFVFDVPVVNKVVGGISDASFGANTSFFSDSQYICGATLAGVPSLVAGATCKQCAAVAGGGLIRLSNNGALPTTIAGAATQSGATRLAIGNDPWSLSTACNGHIQAVGAWPRVLSDAELRQVTT